MTEYRVIITFRETGAEEEDTVLTYSGLDSQDSAAQVGSDTAARIQDGGGSNVAVSISSREVGDWVTA